MQPPKKRLLLVNPAQFGYSAGHYYYCKYLKAQYDIQYICFDRGNRKLELEGVDVTYVDFSLGKITRLLSFLRIITKISKEFNPDVLFVVYFNLSFLVSILSKGKLKILDIRTGSLIQNNWKRGLSNKIIYFQSLFFPRVIILSESLRGLLKISKRKSLILPLGAEIYYKGEKDFEQLNLLYVGSLDGRRIYETVEGFSSFLKMLPNNDKAYYTIIGFGSQNDESLIRSLIEKNNLASHVFFEGLKNYSELAPYFENANVGVAYVPVTEYYQRQPLTKIFEYALSGMFTIATNTYENKRIINNINGTICNDSSISFQESLQLVYNNRSKLKADPIRKTLLNYQWEVLVKNLLYPFISNTSI